MKKMVAVLAVLGVWALILPACGGGSNSGGGGGLWIPVGLARSVDKQFGPVTTVTSSDAAVVAFQ